MPTPLISIITPSFNRAGRIARALESVQGQDDNRWEHLVVDGGSTDGTLQILAGYPLVKFVSEPDQGVYDAFNKGIRLSSGGILGFLNTDDVYPPGIFREVTSLLDDPAVEALAGASEIDREDQGKQTRLTPLAAPEKAEFLQRVVDGLPAINAWFFRRSVFARLGGFDPNFKVAGDQEFMIRFALSNPNYRRTDTVLYRYGSHAGSLTFGLKDRLYPATMDEILKFTAQFARSEAVSPPARRFIRRRHTQVAVDMTAYCLRRGFFKRAGDYAWQGASLDPAWPLLFGIKLLGLPFRSAGRQGS